MTSLEKFGSDLFLIVEKAQSAADAMVEAIQDGRGIEAAKAFSKRLRDFKRTAECMADSFDSIATQVECEIEKVELSSMHISIQTLDSFMHPEDYRYESTEKTNG